MYYPDPNPARDNHPQWQSDATTFFEVSYPQVIKMIEVAKYHSEAREVIHRHKNIMSDIIFYVTQYRADRHYWRFVKVYVKFRIPIRYIAVANMFPSAKVNYFYDDGEALDRHYPTWTRGYTGRVYIYRRNGIDLNVPESTYDHRDYLPRRRATPDSFKRAYHDAKFKNLIRKNKKRKYVRILNTSPMYPSNHKYYN
ncbi:ORF2 [Donkey kirkovirus Hetian-58]|nr:ORF2 [Donkey kirkovirus Hetian-46]UJP31658.1 ORF2 [Donkey kirkovirus Hetian-48]UJP31664.1 ORF2 [Donkey kirkovirus Hetian-58]